MKKIVLLFSIISFQSVAQSSDSLIIRKLFEEELSNGRSYEMLKQLCTNIGPRLSGSPQAMQAVEWTEKVMNDYGFDRVFLQEVMVPHWFRGEKERATIIYQNKSVEVPVCALGGSIATPEKGLRVPVVEVHSFEELKSLGEEKIKNKIVFFNRAMEPKHISTGTAYGGAVNQRGQGAIEAAKYGALAVIVRSMTLRQDDLPHTGAMHYNDSIAKIPACAISTNAADLLSTMLKDTPNLEFYLKMNCQTLPDVKSYNVIGEIKGSEFPEEIIAVGGHLDSWDLAQGAHDDGAGCVQSIEVLRLFKALNIQPKRTIRAVMFMNEENGLRGGKKYAELAKAANEKHIAAIESDAGGLVPRGFGITAPDELHFQKILSWKKLFEPYLADLIHKGGGGADIGPLKEQGVALIGFEPDSQRYFDYHHAANDTIDNVNKRELELGAATMAALVYLIAEYGL